MNNWFHQTTIKRMCVRERERKRERKSDTDTLFYIVRFRLSLGRPVDSNLIKEANDFQTKIADPHTVVSTHTPFTFFKKKSNHTIKYNIFWWVMNSAHPHSSHIQHTYTGHIYNNFTQINFWWRCSSDLTQRFARKRNSFY
jgi:hypothetical protein